MWFHSLLSKAQTKTYVSAGQLLWDKDPLPVMLVEVLHEVPPLGQHGFQAPSASIVLAIGLEVCRDLVDSGRQYADLDFGGARIFLMPLELTDFGHVCIPTAKPCPAVSDRLSLSCHSLWDVPFEYMHHHMFSLLICLVAFLGGTYNQGVNFVAVTGFQSGA